MTAPMCRARDAGHICNKPTGHDGPHSCYCNRVTWEQAQPTPEEAPA